MAFHFARRGIFSRTEDAFFRANWLEESRLSLPFRLRFTARTARKMFEWQRKEREREKEKWINVEINLNSILRLYLLPGRIVSRALCRRHSFVSRALIQLDISEKKKNETYKKGPFHWKWVVKWDWVHSESNSSTFRRFGRRLDIICELGTFSYRPMWFEYFNAITVTILLLQSKNLRPPFNTSAWLPYGKIS